MKIFLSLSFAFVGLAAVSAQVPAAPHPHSLSLHAEMVSAGGTSDVNDSSHNKNVSWDANDPTKKVHETKSKEVETNERGESIKIDVRNLGMLPDTAQVEWYFMARLVQGNQGDYILDQGSKPVTVNPGASTTFNVDSKKVTETVMHKANTHFKNGKARVDHASGERDSGSIITGWVVRVVADNKVLDVRGSKQPLEDQAKDLSKLPVIK